MGWNPLTGYMNSQAGSPLSNAMANQPTAEQLNSYQQAYDQAPGSFRQFEGDRTQRVTNGAPGGVQITQSRVTPEYQQYLQEKGDYYSDLRQQAGWTGANFLTDPNGVRTGPNGQFFGQYTNPYAQRTPGMVQLDAGGGGPRFTPPPGTGGVPGTAPPPGGTPPPTQPPIGGTPPGTQPPPPQAQPMPYPPSGFMPYGPSPGSPPQNQPWTPWGGGGMSQYPHPGGMGGGMMGGGMGQPSFGMGGSRWPNPYQQMYGGMMGFWG